MSKTVFLLGAGASVDARFPLMADLTTRFPTWLQEQQVPERESLSCLYTAAVERVTTSSQTPNIEWVLQLLADVVALKSEGRETAVREWEHPFNASPTQLTSLSQLIRDYIRSTLSAEPPSPADYLHGLLDFREGAEPVDVFTLNYDRLVENMAVRLDIPHTTGFAENWDPAQFTLDGLQLRLYKLHGSVDWFRLVRRPVVFRGTSEHPAFKGEASTDVLLYPTRGKNTFAEPYATLVARFNDLLSKAEYCVSIGYSFRDAHIRRIVIDRLLTNRALQLIVVGPHAEEVLGLTPDEPGEPSFADVADRVSGLWETAKYALENRLIWLRIQEVESADRRLADAFGYVKQRRFADAANELLEAVTLCRRYDLPNKPSPLVKYKFGSEMRDQLAKTIHARLAANAQALHVNNLTWLNHDPDSVASWVTDSVQLWFVATALSLDEQITEARNLISEFVHDLVRGLAFVRNGQLVMWGDGQNWYNPTEDMRKRHRFIEACLNAWDHHAPITKMVDAADRNEIQAFEALRKGLLSTRALQQHLADVGYDQRQTGPKIAFVASVHGRQQLTAISQDFFTSGVSDHWLREPTAIV